MTQSKNGGSALNFTPVRPFIHFRIITLNRKEYIQETSQMAKSYQGDVS